MQKSRHVGSTLMFVLYVFWVRRSFIDPICRNFDKVNASKVLCIQYVSQKPCVSMTENDLVSAAALISLSLLQVRRVKH